jgi:hypothetical protein
MDQAVSLEPHDFSRGSMSAPELIRYTRWGSTGTFSLYFAILPAIIVYLF